MNFVDRKKTIEELLQSMHAIKHKLMVGYASQKEFNITPSQSLVLRFVAENDSTNVKTIAESLHITSSAATQLIDALVENGYLVRTGDPHDRRVILLFLSKKAHKRFEKFKEQSLEKMTELLDVLSDDDLEQYLELNKKIISKIGNT